MDKQDGFALIIILGLAVCFFLPILVQSPTPYIYPESDLGTDLPREIIPLATYIKDSINSSSTLPLWRPYLLSGAPLIGHPVAPVFYPPNWIILALPIPIALNILAIVHIFWIGLGTYLYLRKNLKLHISSSLLGAIIFSQSPKWIAHISGGHWPMLAAISWWPWIWYSFSSFWKTKKLPWAVLLGISIAAQALNHGAFLIMSLLWLSFATLSFIPHHQFKKWLKSTAISWGIATVVAIGLSAIQVFPLLELLPYSTRSNLTQTETSFGSIPPILLVSFFFPSKFKFPELYLYPGIGAILLTTISWIYGWVREEKIWALSFFASLMMGLGNTTPIYNYLQKFIPGLSILRNPSRWWIFALFSIAILSAYGFEKVIGQKHLPLNNRKLTLSILATIFIVTTGIELIQPDLLPMITIVPTLGLLAGIFILKRSNANRLTSFKFGLIIIFDLWFVGATFIRPQTISPTLSDHLFTKITNGRILQPYGGIEMVQIVKYDVKSAGGYDSFPLNNYNEFMKVATGCNFDSYAVAVPATQAHPEAVKNCPDFNPDEKLLNFLGIKMILLPENIKYTQKSSYTSISKLNVYIFEPLFPSAFGVRNTINTETENCTQLLNSIDIQNEAIVTRERITAAITIAPKIVKEDIFPNGINYLVDAPEGGLLVRVETWAPGWKVSIDNDRPQEVMRVNCAFQGIFLEPGTHNVSFEYIPQSYLIGKGISIIFLFLLAVWTSWFVCKINKRKRK